MGGPKKRSHQPPASTDQTTVHFRFQKADPNRFGLSSFAGRDLDCLLKTLADAENVMWREFRNRRDYDLHPVSRPALKHKPPASVSPDETIFSLDVLGLRPARLYGCHQGQYFYIFWFDRFHDAIDMS